jgi:hypothetical protein
MPTSPKDKLSRASWNLLESAKDLATTTLAQVIQEGRLKLDQSQAKMLQDLLTRSIEAGYHRAYPNYMREVDAALADAIVSVSSTDVTKKK